MGNRIRLKPLKRRLSPGKWKRRVIKLREKELLEKEVRKETIRDALNVWKLMGQDDQG